MSAVVPVAPAWLALREEGDARARSSALAAAVGRGLRHPLVVHDLGGGTGSMTRWLAPRLPGPQTWVLHDWNADLVAEAASAIVHDAGGGAVEVRGAVGDLADLGADDLDGASLVTASALLDVLTREELAAIVEACVAARAPVLFALSVTGRVGLRPVDPSDRVFAAAFNDHQRRHASGRRLLGPDAAGLAAGMFRAAGWRVRTARTPWRLGPPDAPLIAQWLDGWVGAAVEQRPALHEWAGEVLRRRSVQLAQGRLHVDVDHLDLAAWPR